MRSNKQGIVSRNEIKILSVMTTVSVAILIAAGRFMPQVLNDTPGYLNLAGFPDMLSQPRTPLYGWLVAVLPATSKSKGPQAA